MPSATPDPSAGRHRPVNPDHSAAFTDLSLGLREQAGLSYGESIHLRVSAGSFDPAVLGLPTVDPDELRTLLSQPPDSTLRARLDGGIREALSRLAAEQPPPFMIHLPITETVSMVINAGYGNESWCELLVGQDRYRVDATGSEYTPADPRVVISTLELNDRINAALLAVQPDLNELRVAQDLRGAELRERFPRLSEEIFSIADGFLSKLAEFGVKPNLQMLKVDIPRVPEPGDINPKPTVEVRYYLDEGLQLDRFAIVG